jgi:hypothetical protein
MQSDKKTPKRVGAITISVFSIVFIVCSAMFLIGLHAFYYKAVPGGFIGLETMNQGIPYLFIVYLGFPFVLYLVTVAAALSSQYETANTTNLAAAFIGSFHMLKWIFIALFASYFTILRAPVAVAAPFIDFKGKIRGTEDVETIENTYPSIKGLGITYYVVFGIILGIISSLGASTIVSSV